MKILLILLMFFIYACAYLDGPVNDSSIEKDMARGIPSRFDLRGGIKFNHKLHYDTMGLQCVICHGKDNPQGGKIKGLGFDYAVKNCIGCHKNMKWAPTACDGCHPLRKMPK